MDKRFYLRWREDFDDWSGWFDEKGLKTEIERLRPLVQEEDGEACIYSIMEGVDRTVDFFPEAASAD